MATQTLKNVILQLRTGSATQRAASTRILAVGEPGVETDSGRIKMVTGPTSGLHCHGPVRLLSRAVPTVL